MELVKDPAKNSKQRSLFSKVVSVFHKSEKTKLDQKVQEPVQVEEKILQKNPEKKTVFSDQNFAQQLQADLNAIDNISKFLKETEILETTDHKMDHGQNSPIQNLPTEIVCKIFDFLSFSEKKNASMVCKKWRDYFLESYYFKNIMVKANNHLFVSNRPNSSSTRTLGHLHRASSAMALWASSNFNHQLYTNLVNIEFINDSADVSLMIENLKKFSSPNKNCTLPKLKSLKFTKTTMSANSLIALINEAPNLEQLSVIECDSLFMTGFLAISSQSRIDKLDNLTSLSLSKNRHLTDQLLNIFINSTTCLKHLDLSYCNFTKTKFKSVSNSSLNGNSLHSCVLTFENLITKINNFLTLESLDLSGVENLLYNQDSFFEFIEILPSLSRIHLENLPNLKLETGIRIIQLTNNLKEINLNNSIQNYDLKQNGVEVLLEKSCSEMSASSIQVLGLNRANINNRKLFSDQFSTLSQLTHLDLSCLMFNSSFGSANKLHEFTEQFATNISKCEQLEHLDLSYCDFLVTDNFIRITSNRLINLKHFNIRNCSQITDSSLHLISSRLKKLVHLDLSWCQNISDYGLDSSINLDQDKKILNEFRKHINGTCRCMRMFAEQPFLMIKAKNGLASENRAQFFGCLGMTGRGNSQTEIVQVWETSSSITLKNLRSLKVLKLESCVNITDLGIFNGLNWKQLIEFDIKLCTNITGDFVKDEDEAFSNLKILSLSQCVKFEEENLLKIVEKSPNLRELGVAGLSNVTNNLIDVLLILKKLLVFLDISFCSDINESYVDRYEQFLSNDFGIRDYKIDKRFISK
ncbi:F-box LRR-repeat 13-like isoform X2 [Brachionus plicatilis]|uniref:F-box LRR-repeat 13-like isoform X2 n=1 Tax=Brachionus plicatilis TaxID=10195 RepID=A0A3M7QI53_BRAPC|nr:F-box LRR-repeat 13-like isoform X2 [Brachionus plicatilis]